MRKSMDASRPLVAPRLRHVGMACLRECVHSFTCAYTAKRFPTPAKVVQTCRMSLLSIMSLPACRSRAYTSTLSFLSRSFAGIAGEKDKNAFVNSNSMDRSAPASSTSESASEQQDANLPGWLKGPQMRQKSPLKEEWAEAIDPKTGHTCWRSNVTGELTVPGVEKPDTWHEVVDKSSGLLYFWNPTTGEATNIGEPKPGPYGRSAAYTTDNNAEGTGADGRLTSGKKKGDKEEGPPLTIASLYNNPLGYLLLGMALFGIIAQNWPK